MVGIITLGSLVAFRNKYYIEYKKCRECLDVLIERQNLSLDLRSKVCIEQEIESARLSLVRSYGAYKALCDVHDHFYMSPDEDILPF